MHLISVIVPIYNTELYLTRCLESICNQSYKNLEIILINDGSTDGSINICNKYLKTDPRIKYVYQNNEGLSSARNSGLNNMKGDFVCFIDSDDFIEINFIESLLDACLKNNVKIATCGRTLIENNSRTNMFSLSNPTAFNQKHAIECFLQHNYFDGSVCDKIFDSNFFLNKRFIKGRIAEDLPITVEIFLENEIIYHVGKPLYNYFKRPNSLTTKFFKTSDLTILDSAKEVTNIIKNKYPDLEKLAKSYYYIYILYIYDTVYISSNGIIDKTDYKYIRFILKSNIIEIILNRYLSFKYKIFLFIYFFKLQGLRNLYIKLKNK